MSNIRSAKVALTDTLPSFTCSLTLDIMKDPVILQITGQTYERVAIQRWLSGKDSCPATGVQLYGNHTIIPNIALKNSIEEWKEKTDTALRALNHMVPFENIRTENLLATARTKDVYKGSMLGKSVAVCVLKGREEFIGDREAAILSTIGKHPSVVQFLARSTDTQGRSITVFELAPLGKNLHQAITDADDDGITISASVLFRILHQIADGMECIHYHGIIHKDLAARNILVFSFDPISSDQITVKICDFGMSSLLDPASTSNYYYGNEGSQKELPVRWMAPESLDRNKWSEKTDVYSFGVLLWEILTKGRVPWGLGITNGEIQERVTRGDRLQPGPDWHVDLVAIMNEVLHNLKSPLI